MHFQPPLFYAYIQDEAYIGVIYMLTYCCNFTFEVQHHFQLYIIALNRPCVKFASFMKSGIARVALMTTGKPEYESAPFAKIF